jgi:hypothetical protein
LSDPRPGFKLEHSLVDAKVDAEIVDFQVMAA